MSVEDAVRSCNDDELVTLMFGTDRDLARMAKAAFDERHAADPAVSEPAHCAECFEGCAKCQPEARD